MLKRELTRISLLALAGLILDILFLDGSARWITPVYVVGLVYAGRTLLGMTAALFRSWGHWQVIALYSRSVLGSIAALIILAAGLAFTVTIGWLFGVVRCIGALYTAIQLDRQVSLP